MISSGRLDMAEEHRSVTGNAQAMGDAMDVKPSLRRYLLRTDALPHAFGENLRPSTRDSIHARRLQSCQHVRDGLAAPLGEPVDLDGRKGLEPATVGKMSFVRRSNSR